ncbi:MAG: 50S ribosomal protein L4 [Candidatus Dojkabacteria bacterium]
MLLPIYNQKAKKVKDVEVSDEIFGADVNDSVLSQYVYIYLSNQREGNANTKTKAQVRGGGKKPFAQKGTGRARAGSIRSPLWKGGGRAHGPKSYVNWSKKTTKQFRATALRSALSKLLAADKLKLIDKLDVVDSKPLTKQALDISTSFGNPKKMTVVTLEMRPELINAFSNIDRHFVKLVDEVNVYDLLNGGEVLIEEGALDFIKQRSKR